MGICIVTGSSGLIGSESVRFFTEQGMTVVGIDNDMRGKLFGVSASTDWNRRQLEREVRSFRHVEADIRDLEAIRVLFSKYGRAIKVVIHCAAQPSHDWAAKDVFTDFSINANGTLNLLKLLPERIAHAPFLCIFQQTRCMATHRINCPCGVRDPL